MLLELLGASWTRLGAVLVAACAVYLAVILLTRLAGVRSLAKMSSFDFAATVAVGSAVASTSAGSVPLTAGLLVLALLYALQYVVATLRRRNLLHGLVDNPPILLMAGPQVLEANLRHARISREELWSQLRLAGVHSRDQVGAVVFETTGDMSVLRRGDLDSELLQGVRGAEALGPAR
ncbi:MAG: YetF domain-containing protein [Mycobacteriales bacterium]